MDFTLDAEARELLNAFDSAYTIAWESAQDIEAYIKERCGGNAEIFLSDVAHTCDYFSIAPILRQFINQHTEN